MNDNIGNWEKVNKLEGHFDEWHLKGTEMYLRVEDYPQDHGRKIEQEVWIREKETEHIKSLFVGPRYDSEQIAEKFMEKDATKWEDL